MADEFSFQHRRQKRVTIFGAGVAGLTAAHELVERGFRVQVWEPQEDQRDPSRGLDVGGLARTQWSSVGQGTAGLVDGGRRGMPLHHFTQEILISEPRWQAGAVQQRHGESEWLPLERRSWVGDETLEAMIVGLSGVSLQLQSERIRLVWLGLKSVLGFDDGEVPRYDARRQLFEGAVGPLALVVPMREPPPLDADTTALIRVWAGSDQQATWRCVRTWSVEACEVTATSKGAALAPNDVVAEVLGELASRPHLDHVYVDVVAKVPDLSRTELTRRIVLLAQRIVPKQGLRWRATGTTIELEFEERPPVTFELTTSEKSRATHDATGTALAISFRVREWRLPGEHGHRFFPAFYHHLFDTMKRTPLLGSTTTGRTTYDQLKPTSCHAIAFEGHRPIVLTRSRPRSFDEISDYARVFFASAPNGGFEAAPRDVAFFMLKLLQYTTSCPERRQDYEQQSWWDFIEGDTYAPAFRDLLLKWPKALVAMDGKSADARTTGTTTTQIMLDMMRERAYRDGILRGPTSEAWLAHWRTYLESQGVEFLHGRLESLSVRSDANARSTIVPLIDDFDPGAAGRREQAQALPGYMLLALPAHELSRIASIFRGKLGETERLRFCPTDSDLDRAANIDINAVFDANQRPLPIRSDGEGEFRHYAGIQFYFSEDLLWLEGQVYHPDSAYGLTTVSQASFWQERPGINHGYRGILSVIIASWGSPNAAGECAYQLPPERLAAEVWHQIKLSTLGVKDEARRGSGPDLPHFERLPEPIYWHLDDNLRWDNGYFNASPFHIIPPGKWRNLPGELDGPRGYEVREGVVLAGTHMKTHTRITSMEAANESARHAVNAILRDLAPADAHTYCDIWNPEEREAEGLAWLRELDAKLKARGSRHVFDLYGFDRLIRHGLTGRVDDPIDPARLWNKVVPLIRAFSRAVRSS